MRHVEMDVCVGAVGAAAMTDPDRTPPWRPGIDVARARAYLVLGGVLILVVVAISWLVEDPPADDGREENARQAAEAAEQEAAEAERRARLAKKAQELERRAAMARAEQRMQGDDTQEDVDKGQANENPEARVCQITPARVREATHRVTALRKIQPIRPPCTTAPDLTVPIGDITCPQGASVKSWSDDGVRKVHCVRGSTRHGPFRIEKPGDSYVRQGLYCNGLKAGVWTTVDAFGIERARYHRGLRHGLSTFKSPLQKRLMYFDRDSEVGRIAIECDGSLGNVNDWRGHAMFRPRSFTSVQADSWERQGHDDDMHVGSQDKTRTSPPAVIVAPMPTSRSYRSGSSGGGSYRPSVRSGSRGSYSGSRSYGRGK